VKTTTIHVLVKINYFWRGFTRTTCKDSILQAVAYANHLKFLDFYKRLVKWTTCKRQLENNKATRQADPDPSLSATTTKSLGGNVTKRSVTVVILSSNGLRWHHIFAHCYYDHLAAATSDRWCYMSLLLLRATVAHLITPTLVEKTGIDSMNYLLTSSTMWWWPWIH
jgi:hypothetical protein